MGSADAVLELVDATVIKGAVRALDVHDPLRRRGADTDAEVARGVDHKAIGVRGRIGEMPLAVGAR